MSSDNYLVRVVSRTGATAVIEGVLTGNAGFGGMPHPGGRALFLMLALEQSPDDGALRADLKLDSERAGRVVLEMIMDAAWLQSNIDRYIDEVEVIAVKMIDGDDDDCNRYGQWLWNLAYGEGAVGDPDALYREHAPSWTARVVFAREEHAAHLAPGATFGTTAFAAWREPPSRKIFTSPSWSVSELRVGRDGGPA